MTEEEKTGTFGEIDFKERVVASVISVFAISGTLTVTPEQIDWHEITEEGFHATEILWCEDDCGDEVAWQRDLAAERAGY